MKIFKRIRKAREQKALQKRLHRQFILAKKWAEEI